jgi:hypothetical protein
MKLIFFLVIIGIISITGCSEIDVSRVSDENIGKNADNVTVCNPPYMQFDASCCLDQNINSICDTEDADMAQVEVAIKKFIDDNLLLQGMTSSINSMREVDGVYEMNISINSQNYTSNYTSYTSKDGKVFFQTGQITNITQQIQQSEQLKDLIQKFIDDDLLEKGMTSSINSMREVYGLYELSISIDEYITTSYISKSGKIFFPSGYIVVN